MSTQNVKQPVNHVADLVHKSTDVDLMSVMRSTVRAILTPLASLRLTVVLLALAVLVIWIVTLEQTRYDIWTVKQKHFPALFVHIPFQTFFPPAWFGAIQEVPGGFFMPSGTLILVLMIANLLAAHLVRMRIQAKGFRLLLGAVVIAAGAIVTWSVVFSGQNSGGFQGSPPVSYQYMWVLIQIGMFGLVLLSIGSIFWMKENRLIEKCLLGLFALCMLCATVFVVLQGKEAFIGDSAMRILWQLIQSTITALILLAGCILVFKRKGGIVLIHLGIGMLMVNELYVTVTNVEQRMTVFEGQTVSHTVDIRSTELMVAHETEDGKHDIVMIPRGELLGNSVISRDDLPFDIECIRYQPNSELIRYMGGSVENAATTGIGREYVAREISVVAGVDGDEIDMASAYVRLTDKENNKELGVHLVSLEAGLNEPYDEIEVDGKSYSIALRFRHYYKPYSITLNDVEREDYVGTKTAKSYSSDFVLNDFEKNTSSKQRIWMNNPLRYGNETFYQSGHDRTRDGREYTVIQIVKNAGWMIPYVACMVVVVGLFAQFGVTLLKFLDKVQQGAAPKSPSSQRSAHGPDKEQVFVAEAVPSSELHVLKTVLTVLAAFLAGSVLIYVGGKAARSTRAKVVKDEMRLDLLGELPITYQGRVKPLDSLARNTLRRFANREEVLYPGTPRRFFGMMEPKKKPAIEWLADVVFQADGHKNVQILRIESLSVAAALGLPKSRKGLKYTLAELERARPELDMLLSIAKGKDESQWTPLEKRLYDVSEKMEMIYAIQLAFNKSPARNSEEPFAKLQLARNLMASTAPRNVYIDGEGWVATPVAEQRKYLQTIAEENDLSSLRDVADYLTMKYVLPEKRNELIETVVVSNLMGQPEAVERLKQKENLTTNREVEAFVIGRIRSNRNPLEALPPAAKLEVNRLMTEEVFPQLPVWSSNVLRTLIQINGGNDALPNIDDSSYETMEALRTAYLAGDAETFNSTLEDELASISANPPKEYSSKKMAAEKFYNGFSPFYMAIIVYIFGCVITLFAWMGPRKLNWVAFGVIVFAVLLHILGIYLRVVISDRPPVTNLYSSFIFVTAGVVIIMLIVEAATRMGVGNMLAGICGVGLLIWAWSNSIKNGDTFTVLVAVLDTQFWLTTHVLCISMGYVATLGAGMLGVAFLIGSLLSRGFDKDVRKTFGKLIYGIVCFALLLSFFGTVLGGLWGDDSWGRFWGWDPKENGALMIVFWNAVVLHARWAGMIRERGLAGLAIIGNVVTIWSWEGVNQLGVGLHSYGVSEGRLQMIIFIAGFHCLLAALAFIPTRFWAAGSGGNVAT